MSKVAGMAWRTTGIWAIALAAVQLGRDMLDWYLPPVDYTMRSVVTTYAVAGIFIALGFWFAWKTRSLRSSAMAAVLAGVAGAVLKAAGIAVALTIWTATQTELSGGIAEALELPWLIIVPGTIFAIMGGLVGKAAAAISRRTTARPTP